jgi:hypothetical protein
MRSLRSLTLEAMIALVSETSPVKVGILTY